MPFAAQSDIVWHGMPCLLWLAVIILLCKRILLLYTRLLLAAFKFRAWAASNSIFGIQDSDLVMDVVNKLRSGPTLLPWLVSVSTLGVPHICLQPFRTHQPVRLVLGRFARVVFLDAGSAVGGSSRTSVRVLFHDICLSRRFSSLLGRKISVCHT